MKWRKRSSLRQRRTSSLWQPLKKRRRSFLQSFCPQGQQHARTRKMTRRTVGSELLQTCSEELKSPSREFSWRRQRTQRSWEEAAALPHSVKKFLGSLVLTHGIPYPNHYLAARCSEPCTRNALGQAFLEEMAETKVAERLTESPICKFTFKELLSTTLQGGPARQAPRMYTSMLAALERNVRGTQRVPFYRIYSWWMLIQSWSSLSLAIIMD